MYNLGILASGRGSNFDAIRRACEVKGYLHDFARIAVLVTDNPDAPVREIARRYGIEEMYVPPPKRTSLEYPDYMDELADIMLANEVHLVCCAGFMRWIQEPFLSRYRDRILNIHPSLLPRFPGLNAQGQAITEGVELSGCTVHYVDETHDGGEIVLQRTVPVYEDDTASTLAERILESEHECYPTAIRKVLTLPKGAKLNIPPGWM